MTTRRAQGPSLTTGPARQSLSQEPPGSALTGGEEASPFGARRLTGIADLDSRVEFFPMNGHDLDGVAALEASVQAFPWSRGNFADSLSAGYSVWICRVGGELAGFSVVMAAVDEAHLLNIAVARRHQGKGVGARLLRQAMAAARAAGARRFLLEVRPSNQQAVELYRHFGFRQLGVRKGYYPATVGREDALVFERELEA